MKTISFSQKIIVCLIAGLVGGQTFLRAIDFVLGKVLPPLAMIIPAVLIVLGPIIYIGIWHWKDKKGMADNAIIKAYWIDAIRYAIAFNLTLHGVQKMAQMEIFIPMGVRDEPFSSISSSWLTWIYFGKSYAFMVTVGLLQILGSLLLVFNRTRLLGVIVLTPIMLTTLLIVYFFDFEMGDLIHSVSLMAGLLFLLALDYKRLVEFFFSKTEIDSSFQTKPTYMKHIGRMSILFIPVLLIVLKPSPDKHPDLTGKYHVTAMSINGAHKLATSPCDSLLTVAYFDIANDCVFEFNGVPRRMYGSYSLDAKGAIQTQWHYPSSAKEKQFSGIVKRVTKDEVELIGHFQKDSIRVKLKKQH